ncbi:uncharacterized protein LOC141695554 [Apium graveolens]|uniref:uncharacterized protein LOC141695554 n=1 Tax=Apium graveolens TaxID=4045 RepID=UPI003D7A643B
MKKAKVELKEINKSKGNLHSAIEAARNELLDFQLAMPHIPSEQRANLQDHLKKEEVFLRQKSRGRWNTNKIIMLTDSERVTHTTHEIIFDVAVDYCQSMIGSSVSVDAFPVELAVPKILDDQRDMLEASFTKLDVFNTFKHMAKHKCPGPDGLTAEFYLATWDIIGVDVTRGILSFFSS